MAKTVLACSSLVKGAGTCRDGVERPRVRVADWEGREAEGVTVVRDAGEVLYRVGAPGVASPAGSPARDRKDGTWP